MKKMNLKKITKAGISFCLAFGMIATAGCGKSDTNATNGSGATLTTGAAGSQAATDAPINIDDYLVDLKSLNYKEYVNADKIKDIVITKEDVTAPESYLKYQVISTAMSALGSKEVERKVEAGDTVTIDYVGYINDIAFQGGTATDASLGIGSQSFIDGFEEGLIGAAIGKEVTLNLKFPDDYSPEPSYAGKACVFKVTVKKIQTLADVDDEKVKSKTGYETLAEYKKNLEETAAKEYREGNIWKKFVESVEVKKDHEGLVEEYYMMNLSMIDAYASMYGVTRAVYLKEAYGLASEDAFKEYLSSYAKQYAKQKLTVLAVADFKNFDCSEQEYNDRIAEYAKDNSVSEEEIKKDYTENEIWFDVIYKKVFDYMYAIEPVDK